jgi:hypothetical protein
MIRAVRLSPPFPPDLPPADPRLPGTEPSLLAHEPDAHWMALDRERVVGRCSLWWSAVPSLPGERIGAIGHYAATDRAAAGTLFRAALPDLAAQGRSLAVGPMDGNTWRRYRFVTERGEEPPFFLEPDNPDAWPQHFRENGFLPIAGYTSNLNPDLGRQDPRVPAAADRLARAGVTIRCLRAAEFEAELARIYAVSAISFRDSFLYTPLPEAVFCGQYLRIRERVRPELVLLAEEADRPVGFVFGIPDWLRPAPTRLPDRVVVKTVAVLPGRCYAGLGNVLVAEVQQRARDLGFRAAIHALMHSANNSRNLSRHYGQPMRRYALFSRALH